MEWAEKTSSYPTLVGKHLPLPGSSCSLLVQAYQLPQGRGSVDTSPVLCQDVLCPYHSPCLSPVALGAAVCWEVAGLGLTLPVLAAGLAQHILRLLRVSSSAKTNQVLLA